MQCRVFSSCTRGAHFGQIHATRSVSTLDSIPQSYHNLRLNPGELSPGLDKLEFEIRRTRLMQKLPPSSIVVLAGYGLRYASQGIFYPFRQNTDFLYLTGLAEPDTALILGKLNECNSWIERSEEATRRYKMTLFVKPQTRHTLVWDGKVAGIKGAVDVYGADEAHPIDQFPSILSKLFSDSSRPIYTDLPIDTHSLEQSTHISFNPSTHSADQPRQDYSITRHVRDWITSLQHHRTSRIQPRVNIKKLGPTLQSLRSIKSEAEVALMKTSGSVAGKAFAETMQYCKPDINEHVLSAMMEFAVKRRGATGLAYVPVVAGGDRALALHYVKNTQPIPTGDMVLMDAGCELGGYASDITRTWPINGLFTPPQQALYDIVLEANKQCIQQCTVSSHTTLNDIHAYCTDILHKGLQRLFQRTIPMHEMEVLFPHHVGHYIGMDVHDTPLVRRSIPLQSGMAVTIEPGLYIPRSSKYPVEYQGIGIRIEDDVVVGDTHCTVLTEHAPKERWDIEKIMARRE